MDIICTKCNKRMDMCSRCEPLSSHDVLGEVQAFTDEILKRINEDKNKLKTIKGQIHGHIRIELIVKEVLSDYEKGEHFA